MSVTLFSGDPIKDLIKKPGSTYLVLWEWTLVEFSKSNINVFNMGLGSQKKVNEKLQQQYEAEKKAMDLDWQANENDYQSVTGLANFEDYSNAIKEALKGKALVEQWLSRGSREYRLVSKKGELIAIWCTHEDDVLPTDEMCYVKNGVC